MRFTFLDNASRLPFFLSRIQVVLGAFCEFQVCPAEAFNVNSSTFRRIEFMGSEF